MSAYVRMTYQSDYDVGLNHRNYTAIDIETTGLKSATDEIIELAAVRYRDGKEVDRFQSLVKPKASIPDIIENLTGINDAMVADAPKIADILPSYLLFLGDDVLLGHNIKFDMGFIEEAADSLDLDLRSNKWNDTMLLSRDIFKGERSHKLKDLCSRLNIPELQEHHALSDCIRTHLCYEAMREYCQEKGIVLPKDRRKSSKGNFPDEPEKCLELDEGLIMTLDDQAFFSYAESCREYAKEYTSYANRIYHLQKLNHDQPSEKVEQILHNLTKINTHMNFLTAETELRKKRAVVVPIPIATNSRTNNNSAKKSKPLNPFLSFWSLFVSVPASIAGSVLLFMEMMVPGAILFGIGALLLIVSYFNQ